MYLLLCKMVKIEYFFKVGVFGEMILSIWLKIFVILLILCRNVCI